MPPQETPGHSQASLGQSLVWSLLVFPGSQYTQASVCALQQSVSQYYVRSGSSMVGLMVTPPRRLMPYPGLLHAEPLPLQQSTADPYLCRRHSNPVLAQSLWGLWVLVHTRSCLCSPESVSPVLCKFWQLCGGINGDVLQEGLCHTQVCCTQSPCP